MEFFKDGISNALHSKRGEGYIDTGVKVVIAVVIGALILGGIYLLFANEGGLMSQVDNNLGSMMDYSGGDAGVRMKNNSTYAKDLQYSPDGVRWHTAVISECEPGATIQEYISHGEVYCAVMRDSKGVYIISSLDNGATWDKRRTWASNYTVTLYWNDNKNCFAGAYENINFCQPILSSDGVIWTDNGPAWDLNW